MSTEFIGSQDNLKNVFINESLNSNFYILPNCFEIGISNPEQSLNNLNVLVDRAKRALENGFYIEFISLKLQYLEFFLRIFYVKKNLQGKVFTPEDKRTFGVILENCKQFGFDKRLTDKLHDFNVNRINAIHKFVLGDTNEEELRQICIKYSKLGNEIKDYVVSNVGLKIESEKDLPDMVGSLLFQVSN